MADLNRAIQINNKKPIYLYEKMKTYLGMNQKSEALKLYPVVLQGGVKIEPEVQALLN
jgi:hypothetical protein